MNFKTICAFFYWEAKLILKAYNKKGITHLALRNILLLFLFICFVFFPFLFTLKHSVYFFIFCLLLFFILTAFLIIRLIILSRSKEKIEKRIFMFSVVGKNFFNSLKERLLYNIFICTQVFIMILFSCLIIYGISSLFLTPGISHFLYSLLYYISFLGISLYSIFLYYHFKKKNLLWIKVLIPLCVSIVICLFTLLLNSVYKVEPILIYIFSLGIGFFFAHPFLTALLKDKNLIKPFRFCVLLFGIFYILLLLSSLFKNVKISNILDIDILNNFIHPVTDTLFVLFSRLRFLYLNISIFFPLLYPFLFFPVLFLFRFAYGYFSYLKKQIIERKIKKLDNLRSKRIFTGSFSFYPFLFILLKTLIILFILMVEIKPLGSLFYKIVDTFRIVKVFKLDFLTETNITNFISFLFYFISIILLIRLFSRIFIYLRSSLTLLKDELIYIEEKIFSRTIIRIPTSNIHYIISKQTIAERPFDVGTLYIKTSDREGTVRIKGLSSFSEKNRIIMYKVKNAV